MLCNNCGKTLVGTQRGFCDSCKADGTSYGRHVDDVAPKDESFEELYRQTLGISSGQKIFEVLEHPAVLSTIGVFSIVLVFGVVVFSFPKLSIISSGVISVCLVSWIAYYGLYVSVLMGLFYEDRTAFTLCIVGLVGVPFVTLLYREEIGSVKVIGMLAVYGLMIVTYVAFGAITPASESLEVMTAVGNQIFMGNGGL